MNVHKKRSHNKNHDRRKNMKRNNFQKRMAAAALALVMLLGLAACSGGRGASDTLKGIYEALIAPDSDYSQTKAMYAETYPELEYSEELKADRITLTFKANGNEYFTDGSWEFVQDGDWLTAEIRNDDYAGVMYMMNVANAIGSYFGMEPDLVSGYLNGLGVLGIESDVFTMEKDEAAGTDTYRLSIAGPWEMKELDQMVLNEAVLDTEALGEEFISQGGNVGKIMYLANGSRDSYTALLAEFGGLDDIAWQSIVNLITLRKPAGYEAFLTDFTELKALETDDYLVDLDPDDAAIEEIMGQRNEKYSYVLVRFGEEQTDETEIEIAVPSAEDFAASYFRAVAGIEQGAAGASLTAAETACGVLTFAAENELWLADEDTLRENMLEAWNSLTDDEQAGFESVFQDLSKLLNSCFEDWEANRGSFADAGAADTMEELMEDGSVQWSWEALRDATWTLGSSES